MRKDALYCTATCRRRVRRKRNNADPEWQQQNRDYQREWARSMRGAPIAPKALPNYSGLVEVRGPDECWPWKGARSEKNYGLFRGKPAHRYGFSQLVRRLQPGETVDHTCHNRDKACLGGNTCEHRPCQNPAHWEACSNWENGSRGLSFAAENARKVTCKWGHELTPENSYGYKGRRQCKTCARLASRGEHPRQLARLA